MAVAILREKEADASWFAYGGIQNDKDISRIKEESIAVSTFTIVNNSRNEFSKEE